MSGPGEFQRQPHTHGRGRSAEETGVAWLVRQGYRLVDQNYSTPAGEIDAVALDGETLCFIEIKARATATYGLAIEAVTKRKQRRLGRAASLYLVDRPHDGPCRFDVLGMDADGKNWRFTLIRDAFELG